MKTIQISTLFFTVAAIAQGTLLRRATDCDICKTTVKTALDALPEEAYTASDEEIIAAFDEACAGYEGDERGACDDFLSKNKIKLVVKIKQGAHVNEACEAIDNLC